MFCPKCGSNQGDSKKFCTVCGTNLLIVSQALTGQLTPPQPVIPALPPIVKQTVYNRHEETRNGITMAIVGGSFLIYQIVNFLFSAPFTGWRSPFGFFSFFAFIIFAVGISKIVSSRVIAETASATPSLFNSAVPTAVRDQSSVQAQAALPHPVFSAATPIHQTTPRTNELDPVEPNISVTEDDTRHLRR